MNYTSSNISKNTDVITQRDFSGTFNDKVIRNVSLSTDSTKQTFNLTIESKQKVSTGSVSLRINGIEQISAENQHNVRCRFLFIRF